MVLVLGFFMMVRNGAGLELNMSGFGRNPQVGIADLEPAPFDPAYLLYSGGTWGYAPPPAGGILNNYAGIANPTAGDDSGDGYSVGSEWINTLTGAVFKCVDATLGAAVWEQINTTGSGNEEAVFLDFDFSTGSPVVVGNLAAGDKIIKSEIKIITPFDGATPTATLGTPASPALIFGTNDSLLTKAVTYSNDENYDFSSSDTLQLTLALGGATTGTGQVLVTIRRA